MPIFRLSQLPFAFEQFLRQLGHLRDYIGNQEPFSDNSVNYLSFQLNVLLFDLHHMLYLLGVVLAGWTNIDRISRRKTFANLVAKKTTILRGQFLRFTLRHLVLGEKSSALHLEALKLVPELYDCVQRCVTCGHLVYV